MSLSMVIAPAFALLQHYFANKSENYAELFILLIASLLIASKESNVACPIEKIFKVFNSKVKLFKQHCNKACPIDRLGRIATDSSPLSHTEIKAIYEMEVMLLDSINFNQIPETPFKYLNTLFDVILNNECKNQNSSPFIQAVVTSASLLVKSEEYLKIPSQVAAAVAIFVGMKKNEAPERFREWSEKIQKENEETFQIGVKVVERDKKECTPAVQELL